MRNFIVLLLMLLPFFVMAQNKWTITNTPVFNNRIDDLFMVDAEVGYSVCGDGQIVKTIDGGNNWSLLLQNTAVYCRSVEFVNRQKGFVGGFGTNYLPNIPNTFRKTLDGGNTWIDLTPVIPVKARKAICGIAVADSNTIYACGNWYQDAGYIIKSIDGGDTWNLIDMAPYATSIIDMHFLNKDIGFAIGKGTLLAEKPIILYTTDGGLSWSVKFNNSPNKGYCWKIQKLNELVYYVSIEDLTNIAPKILKSVDGGMSWTIIQVANEAYNIEGVGFINEKVGWTGGERKYSFETKDGGKTWDTIPFCPLLNRMFRVNDTMMFATGKNIWKYKGNGSAVSLPPSRSAWLTIFPNPVQDNLKIDAIVSLKTHVWLVLFDAMGNRVAVLDNTDKLQGTFFYEYNTSQLASGIYYLMLKTHEDKVVTKIVVQH
jgi:photosystem II stability/assembly factor-like uncharacterized protein